MRRVLGSRYTAAIARCDRPPPFGSTHTSTQEGAIFPSISMTLTGGATLKISLSMSRSSAELSVLIVRPFVSRRRRSVSVPNMSCTSRDLRSFDAFQSGTSTGPRCGQKSARVF